MRFRHSLLPECVLANSARWSHSVGHSSIFSVALNDGPRCASASIASPASSAPQPCSVAMTSTRARL